MKNWIYTCFLILGLANMSNLMASHSLGSDMSYRCIGPDQYEVTLNIYRDCAGASLGSSETVNWTASCGSGSITVNRLANYPIDITPVCVTQPSSCGGGSGPFGVEQHTYTAILNLPAGCTNITFSWNLCCRNNAITTLNSPGSQAMHIEAQLDNSVTPCNNSPVFLNPPVGFACDGFPVFFSDGGFDPDGDSLSFSLVDCQNASATPVSYNAGFTGTNPLTSVSPIHIDSSTGAITFTPLGPQIFVMCVLVEEYRNGVKIGEITRDIQFRILNCTNAAPTATGVDGSSSYETTACANTPICFDIDVADANAGDSITINSNNGLAGSTITTIQDTATGALKGQFCWTPTAADVGKHSFTITLQDDACPIIGTNTYTYDINVAPNPNPPVNAGSNTQICQGQSTTLNASSTATNIQSVWWTPSAGLSNPTSLTTQASPDTTTTYTIHTDHTDGCISTDQVTISIASAPPAPSVSTDSISVCEGESIVLNAITTATSYYWSNSHGFSSTAQSPIIPNASILDTGRYTLYIIDASGCQSLDTFVYVSVNAAPMAPTIVSNSPLCFGDTLNISSSSDCGQSQWIGPNGSSSSTLGTPSASNVLWTFGSATNIPSTDPNYLSGSWYMVCMDTLTGCQANSNTINITINSIPNTPLAFNNGPVCIGESVQLSTSALSGASYAWYADSTQTNLLSTSQNPTITNITTDSTFYLFVTVNGCTSLFGSTTVTVHTAPATPSVPADFAVCEGEAIVLNTTTSANTYVWTGPNGFNSNLQNPSVVNATVVDSGTYTLYIIDANGCLSGDTTVQVIVYPIPTTPLITSNNTPICEGDSLVLTTNTVAGTTFEWFNTANISVGTGDTLVITPTTIADAGSYYLVGTANGCASQASLTTTVSIEQIPSTVAYAGADINLCNQFDTILQATPPTGATGIWTSTSIGTIANPNLSTTVVSNLPSGANVFYWTLSNGTCVDFSTDSVVVDVSPLSNDTANAGLDQLLCGQTTINLNATTPAVSTGYWTQSAAQSSQGVVITNPTNPNSLVTGVQQGNSYTFTWTLSNGNCIDYSSDNVTININVAPPDVAYAGTDIAICNSNTVNLNAYVSTHGTGFWTTNSTATIVDPTNATTPIVNLANNDTSVFYWTLSNGTCMNYSTDSVLVIVSTATDIADAGTNQVVCGQSSLNLAGIAPTVGIGTWSQTANQAAQGINIIDPNDPLSLVTGLQQGNAYTFTWTLTNGSCIDYSSDVVILTITQSPPDNAYAGADIDLCGTSFTNLAAAVPSIATGVWSTSSTATIANPTDPATTIANLPFGTSTFIWTLSGGSCLNYDSDTVVVTVTQPSGDVAYAGLDTAFCAQTTINLSATMPSIGLGYWSQTPAQTSLGVLINDINDPNSLVSGLSAGRTYEFTWTLTNGGCIDYSSDNVLITIDVFPNDVAYAGEDTVLCGGNALDLGATMPPIGTGLWTTNDSAILVNPSLAHSEAVFILEDTTVYYWTLSNGTCIDYSIDSIQVVLAPVSNDLAAAGFDQILCGVDSLSLNGSAPTTSTGLWTQSNNQASQGIIIQNPNDPNTGVTGLQVGNVYNFTWTLSTIGCPNFSTDDVNYTINALPTEVAYAGPDIVLCDGNTTNMVANVPISSTGIWSSNSGAVIINPSLPNTSVVNITADTTQLYWTLSNGSCVDYSIDTMIIIAAPTTIDPADAGLDLAICNETTGILAATNPTIATGVWSQTAAQASLGVSITNPTNPNTGITGLAADQTYSFQWTLSSGPCIDYDSDEAVVEVSRLPKDNAYGGEDIVICGLNQTVLNATPPTVGTGIWTTTSGAVLVNPTEPTTEVLDVQLGISKFVWSISNGACKDYSQDTLSIIIDNAPIANDDSIVIEYNAEIDPISVVDNDKLVGLWAIHLVTLPKKGKLENLTDGTFELTNSDILTTQQFSYRLCNPACPDIFCDTAQVTIKIEGGFDCKVPNVITPNKDEINDLLFIPCLENYPNTKLAIFNRWGDQVYESDNYQNDWGGTYNGNPVPDGTFYYIMILPTGDELQGFVEVRR